MKIQKFKLFFESNQYKSEKVNEFINLLQAEGYEILFNHSKAHGKKIIVNQKTNDRAADYKDLIKKDFLKPYKPYFTNVSGTSSVVIGLEEGEFRGIYIVLKNSKKITDNKTSNINEKWIVDEINKLCEKEPIDLHLTGENNKNITIRGIESAEWYGGKGATARNADKADIILKQTNNKSYGISIKHISAEFYASLVTDKQAESIAKKVLLYAIKNNLTEIKRREGENRGFSLTRSIGLELTDKKLLEEWMFGADLKETGTIMVYDYAKADFKNTGDNEYMLETTILIDNINDITKEGLGNKYPILFILNHEGKRLGDIRNINARLGTLKRVTSNVVMIKESDISDIDEPTFNEILQYVI